MKQSWKKRHAEALELDIEESDDDEEAAIKMPLEKRELMRVQSLQQVSNLLTQVVVRNKLRLDFYLIRPIPERHNTDQYFKNWRSHHFFRFQPVT